MDSIVWIDDDTPSKITITESYISWNSHRKRLQFPWVDIIGSLIGLSQKCFTILAFNRTKDKFKIHRFQHGTHASALEIVANINKFVATPNKKVAVFLNPISGKGKSLKLYTSLMSNILNYSGCEYKLFEISSAEYFDSFNVEEILDFNEIVCAGGDGTIHLLLTCLNKTGNLISKFDFSIIPTGSQNALACELNGSSINSALLSMIKGKARLCGAMKVELENNTELIATTAVSWGLVSDISNTAQNYRIFGPWRYEITSFCKVFQTWKKYSCEITTQDSKIQGDYMCVLVGKHTTKSSIGGEIVFPKANICDGFIDLETFDPAGRLKTIKVFNSMKNGGEHIKSKKVNYRKEKFVTIAANSHFVFNIDGEIYHTASVRVHVLENYINYLIL